MVPLSKSPPLAQDNHVSRNQLQIRYERGRAIFAEQLNESTSMGYGARLHADGAAVHWAQCPRSARVCVLPTIAPRTSAHLDRKLLGPDHLGVSTSASLASGSQRCGILDLGASS